MCFGIGVWSFGIQASVSEFGVQETTRPLGGGRQLPHPPRGLPEPRPEPPTLRHTDRQSAGHTVCLSLARQTDWMAGVLTDRETGRQTDSQGDRQTGRQRFSDPIKSSSGTLSGTLSGTPFGTKQVSGGLGPITCSPVERTRHTQDSQGQILAFASWIKSLHPLKKFPLRSGSGRPLVRTERADPNKSPAGWAP